MTSPQPARPLRRARYCTRMQWPIPSFYGRCPLCHRLVEPTLHPELLPPAAAGQLELVPEHPPVGDRQERAQP